MARAAPARRGRRPGQTSRKIAAASRKVGKLGGRPRSELADVELKQIGIAPLGDPLKLARWFTDAIALLTQFCLEGKPYRELLALVRASAASSGKTIPHDIMFQAAKLLRDDERDVSKSSTGSRTVARKDDAIAQAAAPPSRREAPV